jgi:hypothetical protein
MEHHHFECQCSTFDHLFRMSLDPDDGTVVLTARLNHFLPWYRRVWTAVRYVFKTPSMRGEFDVTLIGPDQFFAIHDLLDRAYVIDTLSKAPSTARAVPRSLTE